jgi:xylan 1,4-beta-xylosidase
MKTIVLKLRILIFCVVFFSSDVLLSQMLNPQTLSNEWAGYGIGDPYILKFKGKYYLYCSTRDDMTGVKVWSSWDLFNWTYEGSCTTELISKGAYAPEVIYYNGTFYMYTSPGGAGHYVLSSDSPTGPFVVKTGNLGHSIDGNVLIDDDASLIFTHSSGSGIIRNTMSSPLAIDGAEVNTGLALNGWTEGSTLFKRNGLYYLTYTGNHVFSPGYRVAYGMSNSLATTFTAGTNNPVILNTEGAFYGLGHNCSVIGPDLDTWYMGYHNLLGPGAIGPLRKFNLDPMGFNGNKMVVYGPTSWTQPVPALPTFYDRFNRTAIGVNWTNVNGGNWGIYNQELMWQDQIGTAAWYRQLTTQTASSDYTAEFNMKEINRGGNNARFGAVFSYLNESNYGTAVFSSFNNTLEVNYFVNGVSIGPQSFPLLPGWNYQKWHSIRVEKYNSTFKVFIDNMLKSSRTVNGLDGGKIGLATFNDHADFGYTAFSNNSNGSAIFSQYKPVPGVIEAVHFNSGGENIGYHDNTATNIGGAYRNEGVDIRDCHEGGHNIGWNSTGEWYKYNVNIKSAGKYNIGVRYATINTGCQIRVLCDGIDVTGVVNLPATGGWDAWRTEIIKMVSLPAGICILIL